ncbi:LysR family transcriptional regulator [Achromobacter xylosoxidans]|uniref:LysR family transcriptional regulator n=1 Tax=Alcaligenes xylosoxydans xylosoxydans TaxID=85698 RepID=UPI001EEC1B7B|nr:LysR family transcriptional regulator [Achromobacter xylosoxidans]
MKPRISLDQWRTFISVVDEGGFAQAATTLNKSQSTVSYAVRQIEEQLGLAVFQIEGRKALLTRDGKTLYRRGKALVEEAARLERAAHNLAKGQEQTLSLAVETLFPTWLMLQCLDRFGAIYPEIRIELHETVMGGTDELLQAGAVDLAICADNLPVGHTGDVILRYRAICAAAPAHPLHRQEGPLTLEQLKAHRHLVIRDSGSKRSRPSVWDVSERRLTVSHKATSIHAACMGLGFAWYPEDWISDELRSGQLRPLPLQNGAERSGALYLVYPDPDGAGPGARELGRIIRDEARRVESRSDARQPPVE